MSQAGGTPVRRIVTGHEQARARVKMDDVFQPVVVPSGDAAMALVWTTATVPANNNDDVDGRQRDAGLTLKCGSVIRVVDMLPGCQSPMHRTNSIDYGIVLSGEIELELDDGVTTSAGPGDIIVQRGTSHLWRNKSATQICRIVFVLIEAPPYVHKGQPLAQHLPK
jgi:quercetin dioxygenase-like cupin family protein